MVFLDEAGTRSCDTRRRGRAPIGVPVIEAVKHNRGYPVTMIAALTHEGMRAMMTIEGGTSGDVFVAWLEHFLLPELPVDALVVMDNLAAHKDKRVHELLDTVGAKAIYLPPYSPTFNPIELAWAKLKYWIRTARPTCHDTLDDAIAWSLDLITQADSAAWFRHCGWATP